VICRVSLNVAERRTGSRPLAPWRNGAGLRPTPLWRWRAHGTPGRSNRSGWWTSAKRKKKEGRPLPVREVPRRPKFHQLGCGFEPVRRYNVHERDLFPARDLFLWTNEKGTRPAGCLTTWIPGRRSDCREMSAFLASCRTVPEDSEERGPLPDQAAICTHRCGGVTRARREPGRKQKCCPRCGGSKVGRFAATSLDP